MDNNRIKQVYSDQAYNLLNLLKVFLIIDLLTYVIPIFVFKEFDFGVIFSLISFIFVVLAYDNVTHDLKSSKIRIMISIIPMAWIIIYDLIDMLLNADSFILVYSFTYAGDYLKLAFLLEILILVLQIRTYIALSKSLGEKQFIDPTEEFYNKD